MEDGQRAFSTFRVLNGDANILERDQLFRNMAQLYSYVSDRCDDEQVSQYDEVLCQLASSSRSRRGPMWPSSWPRWSGRRAMWSTRSPTPCSRSRRPSSNSPTCSTTA